MTRRMAIVALAALAVAGVARAEDFWVKKEWKSWSANECKKLLEDSPWARKWGRSEVREVPFGRPTSGTGRESEPEIHYVVQLRSALPVRQAVVRMAQIDTKYDQLNPQQKKQFDDNAARYLGQSYDTIVVHVLYGSNVQLYEREMARVWQGYPEGTVPQDATLINARGQRVPAMRLVSKPGGAYEFELIFPRLVNNVPFVQPDDKSVSVEFSHPDLTSTRPSSTEASMQGGTGEILKSVRIYLEFKLEKMQFGGAPAF